MNFEPIISPDAVRVILRHEAARHRMIVAAYGVILASSKAELMSYLQRTPERAEQAPELLSWLLKHGQGETPEAELLRGAAVRLSIVLHELRALPVVH